MGLKTTVKEGIKHDTIKNLLIAQRRLADEGSAADLIRVTKHLLHLAEKFGDVLVDIVPEAKGSDYTEGLIAGINIGTVTSSMDAPEKSRDIHGV